MKFWPFDLDTCGAAASTLCMIHCLVFPVILSAMTVYGAIGSEEPTDQVAITASENTLSAGLANSELNCLHSDCCAQKDSNSNDEADDQLAGCCSNPTDYWIHVGLLALVAPLGLVAWGHGYRQHGQSCVIWLGGFGVVLLTMAILFGYQIMGGRGEQMMTITGSVFMVSAHLWNRHHCRCCGQCTEENDSSASDESLLPS